MLELWNGMTHFEVEKGRVRVRERVCVCLWVLESVQRLVAWAS